MPAVPFRIDDLDPSSTGDVTDAAALMTMAWRIALLDETEPDFPPADVRRVLLAEGEPGARAGWVARDGDRPVALCTVVAPAGNDRARMPELWVLPSDRRRGIGSALLELAVAFGRAHDRTVLEGNHYEGAPASVAFARRHGATPAGRTEQLRLRVSGNQVLEAWDDGTNASVGTELRAAGYRAVAVWRDVELRLEP
jgi:GNAT superfamily N-acetyltransferase